MSVGEADNLARRGFLGAAAGAAVLAFGAAAPVVRAAQAGSANGSAQAAVRTLLTLSSRKAFDALAKPDGFWDSTVARINLPVLFGKPGALPAGVLSDTAFREQLQRRLNGIAREGVPRASATVARGIRRLAVPDGASVFQGEQTAATTLLRSAMGPALVNALIPPLNRALRRAKDPLVAQAVAGLKGVDYDDVAQALANETDNAIWYQLGAEEAAIRRAPDASGDAALTAALKGA